MSKNPGLLSFSDLQIKLEKALQGELPGQDAQYKLAPVGRGRPNLDALDQRQVRKAAVLALFYPENDLPKLILILRVKYEGVHSGQISFPGGRREKQDAGFQETALRETHEEIGIAAKEILVLGKISPLYIPPSNYLVHPYIGLLENVPDFEKQKSEVAEIISIDFNQILDEGTLREQIVTARGFKQKVPVFEVGGVVIWGATAMMLSEIREMISPAPFA